MVLYLDGIRYSIEIVDLAFQRLLEVLEKIARAGNASAELAPRIIAATADTWTIVDSTHRLRELVQQLPGLKQNQPEVQLLLRNTESLKDFRHFFQHFRTEIHSYVERRMPLWGVLSWTWINSNTGQAESHTIVPGTFYHQIQAAGCIFDTHTGRFIDRVVLHAGAKRFDLADVYDRVAAFAKWFEEWYERKWSGDGYHGADVHFAMTFQPIDADEKVSGTLNEKE